MTELEDRLREVVLQRSASVEPSTDLPDRIEARMRRHRRRRQLVAGAVGAGIAAAVVLVVALLPSTGRRHDDVRVGAGPTTSKTTTSTTSAATSTTTTSVEPSSTTVEATEPQPPEPLAPDTPLSRQGVGPITAGMTLRQAEQVAGVTITPFPNDVTVCTQAEISEPGFNVGLLAEDVGDPMDSVIRTVSLAVEGRTEEGVAVGDPVARLDEVYGAPTRTEGTGDGSEVRIYQSGAYAYAAWVNVDIAVLESGDANWVGVGDPDDCI